ncbi:MAG: CCA tRNA nucleotidyltransferase [Rhodospirillales bacterium]|nr:CCA tRNA nucleotidyltransferase [Rhodospirillales bacterium]
MTLLLEPRPDFLADPALARVLAALPGARLVGGCVRDALAGLLVHDIDPHDIDLASPLPPEAAMAALRAAGLRAVPTGIAHGTVTAVADGRGFEVTTLRRDVATDGRHAVVAFTDDWRVDAARRDFTINAMSMTAIGMVHDYFGGIADLRAGRVRFVGDPATRIAEDRLRMLRFFRFHARFGIGPPDPAALAAIADAAPGLARLSPERVWSELKRILAAPAAAPTVALMAQAGVLAAALPEGADPARLAALEARGAPADPLLRLAALLPAPPDADAAALAARLRLSTAERDHLVALRAGPAPGDSDDDAALSRLLADTPRAVLLGRSWLAGAGAATRARLAALAVPAFPLHGRDLAAAGVPAGPAMGALLRELRGWWLAGGCLADAAACMAELSRRRAG